MRSLGVIFQPAFPPERFRAVIAAAEESGVDECWLWEDCFRESGIAAASAALAWTTRLRVGIGILPMPLRNVALTAMEAATIARLFPDRLQLGVGHGVQSWMGQVGARVASPLTLMREYVPALRSLLAGEQVTTTGRYVRLDGVQLDWPPLTELPVLAAGEGPRTLALTGAVADGTVLTGGSSLEVVRRARALVADGRREAGRAGSNRIVVFLMAAYGDDALGRLDAEFRHWEFGPEKQVAAAGSARDVASTVEAFFKAGADTVVLQPTTSEPDLEGFVRRTGTEVAPLIRR